MNNLKFSNDSHTLSNVFFFLDHLKQESFVSKCYCYGEVIFLGPKCIEQRQKVVNK